MTTALLGFALASTLVILAPGPDSMLVMRNTMRGGRRAGWVTACGTLSGLTIWALAAALGLSALLRASHVGYDILRFCGAAYLIWLGVTSLAHFRRKNTAEPLAQAGGSAPAVARPAAPGLTVPGLTAPGLTAPGLTVPGLTMPGLTVPGLTVPGLTAPGLTAPGLTMPGLTTPGLTVPGLTAPGLTAPGLTVPGTARPRRAYLNGLLSNLLNPKISVFFMAFLPAFVPAGASAAEFSLVLGIWFIAETGLWLAVVAWLADRGVRWLRRPAVQRWIERVTGIVLIGFGLRLATESRRFA